MDDAWQDVLTHTAFSDYEHTQIYRRHFQCNVDSVVQCFAVSYDIVTQFDVLQFGCLHFSGQRYKENLTLWHTMAEI